MLEETPKSDQRNKKLSMMTRLVTNAYWATTPSQTAAAHPAAELTGHAKRRRIIMETG
jgi:hypothetical protein